MSRTDVPTRDIFESGRRGLSHNGVRRANEKAVLTVVGFNSGVSNAEISRLCGLAPQTVSAILIDLERGGLVTRGPVMRGRRGQPATPILLNADGGFSIGVEIGWRHLDVVLLNMHAQVLQHRHVDHAYPDAETVVDTIAEIVEAFSATLDAQQRSRLLDLGVAMPGRLADNIDLLDAPPQQAELWRALNIAAALEARSGLSVTVFNDGNAGCWAELIALAPPRPANIIYLLVSHYVAAGIIGDGALWEGPTGNAAELGSILVNRAEAAPEVAHMIASAWALRQHLHATGHSAQALPTQALDRPEFAAATAGWIEVSANALAQVIYNTTTMVEQPLVVIDTVLSADTGARLVERVRQEMTRMPTRSGRSSRVVAGQLGAMAPVIGAAELPLFRRHF